MNRFSEKITNACKALCNADAILVGAGAGLSTSAGLNYYGREFQEKFADYIEKYNFSDLYSAGFYDFPGEEEKWAYWARHVDFTHFSRPAFQAYLDLRELVEGKEYFILTTNVDRQFYKADFNPERIFAVQGSYDQMQCAMGCHSTVYSNKKTVEDILANSHNLTVDSAYVPLCPKCGGPMDMYLRKNDYFVEDAAWNESADKYERFLEKYGYKKIVLLELGIGFNTPGIVRYPFEEIASINWKAVLIRINKHHAKVSSKLSDRAFSFENDAAQIIKMLIECRKTKCM